MIDTLPRERSRARDESSDKGKDERDDTDHREERFDGLAEAAFIICLYAVL